MSIYKSFAKSLQSCLTLCDPIDGSPPGFPIPGILQARTLECVAISFSNAWKWKEKVKSLSRVWLLATPRTAAYQAPPSIGFSRQCVPVGKPLYIYMREGPIGYSKVEANCFSKCNLRYTSTNSLTILYTIKHICSFPGFSTKKKKSTSAVFFLIFPGGSMVKRLPTIRETQVWSLGWEDPLEKKMATHSSTLAWKIPWTEERGRLQSMGSQRVRHEWVT